MLPGVEASAVKGSLIGVRIPSGQWVHLTNEFQLLFSLANISMAASAKILDHAVYRRFMALPQVCGMKNGRCFGLARVMLKFLWWRTGPRACFA